jgi:hypothetical protein
VSEWDDLESPLTEAPLFYVQPKDRDPALEHDRQSELVRRLRAAGLHVIAIPNGRAWGAKAWNLAKAEGVVWGAPDLIINARGRSAYIEMKSGTGAINQHQVEVLNSLHRLGFPVAVCRTADGAIAWLEGRGFSVGVRRAA